MFGLASGYYQNYLKPPDVRLLLVGLDGAGKTALLERLKVTDFKRRIQSSSGKRLTLDTNTFQKRTPAPQDDDDDHDENDDVDDDSQPKLEISSSIEPRSNADVDVDVDVNVNVNMNNRHDHRQLRNRMCPTTLPNLKKQMDGDNDEEYVYDFPSAKTVGIKNRHKDTTKAVNHSSDGHEDHHFSSNQCSNGNRNENEHSDIVQDPSNVKKKLSDRTLTHLSDSMLTADENKGLGGEGIQEKQYDLKTDKTMFPLHLIKPTVGMNLGKLEGGGAKVKIMDLGGATTMRPLWERYYADVHGIAFVVDISPTSPMSKLMESRAFYRCMRDDESLMGIPIVIFGNKVDERCNWERENGDTASAGSMTGNGEFREGCGTVGEVESSGEETLGLSDGNSLIEITELFLSAPRGSASRNSNYLEPSNGLAMEEEIAFFAGSAKTGAGVREAFEWLIHEAKVVEKERQLKIG